MSINSSVSFIIILFLFIFPVQLFSQAGKDGAETVTTSGVIFNRYTYLASSATAGSINITVNNAANLGSAAISGAANNPYAKAALDYGDVVMIIKMQGASINTTNTVSYGSVTALNGTGTYEFKTVRSVSANLITFCSGLTNAYTVGGTSRVQVIRIPRLSTLTVNNGASVTAPAWNGTTGGIVALEVNGNTVINGSVTVDGLGFRGGVVDNNTSGAPGGPTNYVNSASTDGAEKGESIAGFQADYDGLNGRYDRGAPANGGGGGNAHNGGGGGGANGNNGNTWTGQGVMLTNASNPASAWALDPGYAANGNVLTNSSGGGRGGYTYGANDQNATTVAPGNTAWAGDYRREAGGLGGRPLTYTTSTLFFGGGGGSGDGNNTAAQNGANGGGIIYLHVAGNLSGTGAVSANGAAAGPTISAHNDAPGGGGGGGAIRLNVSGTISTTTIRANGGAGGNQLITSAESEGPGGGGGGGYIQTTGTPTVTVNGAVPGTTTSTAVTEFTYNGATGGAAGQVVNGQTYSAIPVLSCFRLPVTLRSFTAILNQQKEAVISWQAESETGMSGYELLVSNDGQQWQLLQMVPALNNSELQLYSVNAGVLTGSRFYRLRIVNQDQSYTYSEVRLLAIQQKVKIVVSGESAYITGLTSNVQSLQVYNQTGSLLETRKLSNDMTITVSLQMLPSGLYLVKLTDKTGKEEWFRFIKP